MTDCIFCKIVAGEIPSAKVYEDDKVLAFLDISQVTPGHTLIIPKEHVKDIFDYESAHAGEVFARVPKIARAIQKAFPDCQGINIMLNNGALAYQSVFHSHIHLLPRYSEDDDFAIKFVSNQGKDDMQTLSERADQIAQAIEEEK